MKSHERRRIEPQATVRRHPWRKSIMAKQIALGARPSFAKLAEEHYGDRKLVPRWRATTASAMRSPL